MKAIGLENGRHVQRHMFPFPYAALLCRLSRMAVGTEDLTLCDLYEDRRPRETGLAHVGHIFAFVAKMIEVEDDRSRSPHPTHGWTARYCHMSIWFSSPVWSLAARTCAMCFARLRSYQALLYSAMQPLHHE